MQTPSFQNAPLRERVREKLLRELVAGHLPEGMPIRLAPLAARLSISMTPAREALTQLEREGWVVLHPNRGFFAAPFTVSEANNIYPLIAHLESMAIRLNTRPFPAILSRLDAMNQAMRRAADNPRLALDCDRRWHDTLVQHSPNSILLDYLRDLRLRSERYERAYMRESTRLSGSVQDHREIAKALVGAPDLIPTLLADHWERSRRFIEEWLNGRNVPERS